MNLHSPSVLGSGDLWFVHCYCLYWSDHKVIPRKALAVDSEFWGLNNLCLINGPPYLIRDICF